MTLVFRSVPVVPSSDKHVLTLSLLVVLQYYFTVTFSHDNQKALELRTEDVKDCDEWVAAITQARYVSHTAFS